MDDDICTYWAAGDGKTAAKLEVTPAAGPVSTVFSPVATVQGVEPESLATVRYHWDFDGLASLRVHVYLTDVGDDDAPMRYMRGSHLRSRARTPAHTATVRTVYIIGPDKKVRLTMTYPMSVGRNFAEILRALDAVRATDGVGHVGSASADVRMERLYPVTTALADVTAKLGGHASLWYHVDEPAAVSATVTVEIGIYRVADDRLVRTVRKARVPVGTDVVAKVALQRSWCAAGRYVWRVSETDVWGSSTQVPAQKRLLVTR